MSMTETIKADIANYEKQIQEKKVKFQELKTQMTQLEAEINLFNGALQQCVKLLNMQNDAEDVAPETE